MRNDNNNHWPKSDIRYWEGKVAFQTPQARTYSVQIQHAKRRAWINLHTANKEQAAILARKFYEDLRANGWEAAHARRRPADGSEKKVNVTVGEYIEAVTAKSLLYPKTVESYAQALRKIAGDITGQANRDSIKLRSLTPEKIEAWRIEFIRKGSTDPLKEKSAKVSANSLILRARSLFGVNVLARVSDSVELPEPLPFAGVKTEKMRVSRYRATFDMAALIEAARAELPAEQFKIFCLAAMVGLRRSEIDLLPWAAFRCDEGVLRIEATKHYRPKTHGSEGDVLVDPELMDLFRGFHAAAKGEFVVESAGEPPAPDAPYGTYRCAEEMRGLLGWLRAKGVNGGKPLHTLRKEFGSQINARYGLTAASEMLRHADIAVTAAHYVENKHRSVLGFGHLLKGERTIIPMDKEALARAAKTLPEI
jgi:integrase